MVKAHTPINWENEPSYNTPVNAANLNKMDSEIGILDDRLIAQDTSKLDKSVANTMVKDISFNENTGIFTITFLNGSTKTLDTKLEKIATNFRYDYSTQTLILTLIDGTTQSIDMSALITQYEFTDSATIDFSVGSDGKITATIKKGSITEDMLQPNYLADIKVETAKSQQSMENAKISENNAKASELAAKQYAEDANMYEAMTAQTTSGNNPTATNSTDAPLIYLNNGGYTEQQGEPYFTGLTNNTNFVSTNIIPCKNGDVVTITSNKTYFNGIMLQAYNGDTEIELASVVELDVKTSTYTISDEMFQLEENTITGVQFRLYGGSTTDKVTVTVNGNEKTTPTPDAPIRIASNGDKGYFDGELYGGYMQDNGTINRSTSSICGTNKILCKASDVIKIKYNGIINVDLAAIYVSFYDAYNNFISQSTALSNVLEVTAPTNTSYMLFCIAGLVNVINITPSTAKHITVTINGQYALRVETQNKNVVVDAVNNKYEHQYGNALVGNLVLKPNTYYTISFDSDTAGNRYYTNETITEQKVFTTVVGRNVITTKTKDNIKGNYLVDRVVILKNYIEQPNSPQFDNLQIEEGEVTTPYEPHKSTTAFIPISSPFYEGDFIEVYADGSGQIYRENKEYEVTQWQDVTNSLTNTKELRSPIISDRKIAPFKCEIASYVNTTWNVDAPYICSWGNAEASQICLRIPLDGAAGDHLCKFVYKLATPTSTPLTQEQVAEFMKLQTFKGVTYVTADGEVTVRYYCNNDSGETVSMLQEMASNSGSGDVTELFKTITVTETATLPANRITDITIPINVPSGYSILGIKSIYNNTLALLYGFSCRDDSASISVKNTSELELQGSVTVNVSCIKTNAIS